MCEQIYIGVKCRELHARNIPHSPALVWLALVHLLDLDDVGLAEVLLLADDLGLADARHEGDGLVVLGAHMHNRCDFW